MRTKRVPVKLEAAALDGEIHGDERVSLISVFLTFALKSLILSAVITMEKLGSGHCAL